MSYFTNNILRIGPKGIANTATSIPKTAKISAEGQLSRAMIMVVIRMKIKASAVKEMAIIFSPIIQY
jgi:hypothetical protein